MGLIRLKSKLSHFLLFFMVSTLLLVSCFSSSHVKCRSEEKSALLQFRSHFSCNGSPDDCSGSSFAISWKEDDEDCCDWDGVDCDEDTGYVISLYLRSNWLYGNFPLNSSLFNLTHLQYLDLSGNDFKNSQISHLFGNFENLTTLHLDDSGFSGVVPNAIFQLTNLEELDLSGNIRLTGKLPDSIGELASLEMLSLGSCNFSGLIPTSIGNLIRLYTLNISDNNFIGQVPASLSNIENLDVLDLSHNNLEGQIIPSILNLTSCSRLDLSANQFIDAVELDVLTKLKNLEYLDLSNSGISFTTSNSDFLSAFPFMSTLGLSSCGFGTNLLTNLSVDSELLYIDLSNNTITTELDASICTLTSLLYLDLSHNKFYGLIPPCLGNFSGDLLVLNLQSNRFHGMIPQSFGYSDYAVNLKILELSNNLLRGKIPRSLVDCTELEVLNLGFNMLNDGFPFWLGNLSSLKVLVLRGNNLYGTISENLTKKDHFTNIHIFDMSNNNFTGTLPSRFFECWNAMTIVDQVDASTYAYVQSKYQKYYGPNNQPLSVSRGCTPNEVCWARYTYYYSINIMNKGVYLPYKRVQTAMKVVDVSANNFNGSIPLSVGGLKGMHVLNLSGNALTGQVPWFLGNLSNLESLDLSNNKLSGEIPQEMSKLNFLEVLDLSQNNLTGAIPSYLDKFPNASFEGNQGLCGLPLYKLCKNVDRPNSPSQPIPSDKKQHFEFNIDDFGWEVVVGYGGGLVIGLVIGYFIPVRNNPWFARAFNFKVHQSRRRGRNSRSG